MATARVCTPVHRNVLFFVTVRVPGWWHVRLEYHQVSKTYRHDTHPRWEHTHGGAFRCRRCKAMVCPPPSGGQHRNHCPCCLFSRHLDDRRPGDRASDCGALMEPSGIVTRRNGEYALIHRCLGCGIQRHNRIAADDDFDLVRALPAVRHAEDEIAAIA